jgi:RsiW-degrading membrane proteinase PrsW (M82 family)
MSQQVKIIFIEGPRSGEEIFFNDEHKITFGRDPNCNVMFSGDHNPTISRNHAYLMHGDGRWLLVDESKNGTLVNSQMNNHSDCQLNGGETIRFSKSGEAIRVEFSSLVSEEPDKSIPTDETSPSMTKILPMSKEGFYEQLRSQSFFWPGIVTVVSGLMMFISFSKILETGDEGYAIFYEGVLGVYIGLATIFFIVNVADIKLPTWIPIASALFTILMLTIEIPFYFLSIFFRPPIIQALLKDTTIVGHFIGHFIGAGLMEELFKAFPVFIALAFVNQFKRLNISGFEESRLSPTLAVVIGSSSAVGFIIYETLMGYVPNYQAEGGIAIGLMLLIPRFITGIAGHAAWSGIFAYFIALGFYYKKKTFFYPFMGWMLASGLHGLWNTSLLVSYKFMFTIGVGSFIVFIGYLFKARQSFS